MKKKFVSSCIASTIIFGTLLGVTYKAEAATVHVAGGVCLEGVLVLFDLLAGGVFCC